VFVPETANTWKPPDFAERKRMGRSVGSGSHQRARSALEVERPSWDWTATGTM
jgi:hypothetical protein